MHDPIHRLTKGDLPRLRDFWMTQWGADFIVAHDQIIRYDEVDGFIFEDWLGVATFMMRGDECELTSLDSLHGGQGVGTALVENVVKEAKEKNSRRVFLITTNDNLYALGFYQRRGFELVAVHRGAVTEARKLKPSIPLMGENNIPLRDEIELEIALNF